MPAGKSSLSRLVFLVITVAAFSGCFGSAEVADDDGKGNQAPTVPVMVERGTWFIHHVGGCEGGNALMDRSMTEAEYDWCNDPDLDEAEGKRPVEVWPATNQWGLAPKGSLVHGRLTWREAPSTQFNVSIRLVSGGEIVAKDELIMLVVFPDPNGVPPRHTESWILHMVLGAEIPAGATPALELWVRGTLVWSVGYGSVHDDPDSFFCVFPPDEPWPGEFDRIDPSDCLERP